jgi:anti-sigma factor RsiW
MAKLNQKLLERYYDGELRPDQAKQVEEALAETPALKASFEETARLGDLLRLMNEESLEDVSFNGFEARVRSGIANEKTTGVFERLRVWAADFFAYRKPVWVPAVAVVGACAVALVIAPMIMEPPVQQVNPPHRVFNDNQGSKIESVTFNDAEGAKYEVKDGQGGTVGVVWIDDTPAGETDRDADAESAL